MSNKVTSPLLAFTILLFMSMAVYPKEAEDDALYLQGKKSFYNNNYQQAIQTYQRIVKNFPNSKYIPDAYFWIGYSHERLSQPIEALQAYEMVIKTDRDGRWAGDARAKMVDIATVLIGQGSTNFQSVIKEQLDHVDRATRLRAMLALAGLQNETVLPLLVQTFRSETNPAIKMRMFVALENYQPEKIKPVLAEVLKSQDDAYLKLRALQVFERFHDPSVVPILKYTIENEGEPAVRFKSAQVLSSYPSDEVTAAMLDVLRNNSDEKMRQAALNYLQRVSSKKIQPQILAAVPNEPVPHLRLQM